MSDDSREKVPIISHGEFSDSSSDRITDVSYGFWIVEVHRSFHFQLDLIQYFLSRYDRHG